MIGIGVVQMAFLTTIRILTIDLYITTLKYWIIDHPEKMQEASCHQERKNLKAVLPPSSSKSLKSRL